ncbi:MAG: InlB B-repeat-containing protein, partial [Eubacterium sp.]|nr:InlB B-repeat-containing protein [Eubacterium sp.]
FTSGPRYYTVQLVDSEDGVAVASAEFKYNEVPSFDKPSRKDDARYKYALTQGSWDITVASFAPVTKDAIYEVEFERTIQEYLVTFSYNDKVHKDVKRTVEYGKRVGELPELYPEEGFTGKWTYTNEKNEKVTLTSETVITGILTASAEYAAEAKNVKSAEKGEETKKDGEGQYTVTFMVNGEVLATVPVEENGVVGAEMPADPKPEEGFKFDGWFAGESLFTAETPVTGDIQVTASFSEETELRAEPEIITVTFDPNTEEDGQLAPITIQVESGTAIGDQLPAVPTVPGYNTKWVIQNTTTVVTAETLVTEPFTAVVGKDIITYTITFLDEEGNTLYTRTVDIDSGYALSNDDYPAVPEKTNKVGKWVLQGTTTEFPVGTVVSGDVTVEPEYEQNIFTVTFKAEGSPDSEFTTAKGTTIVLPSDPIKAGATFGGWFTEQNGQGTQYTASSTVNEDLTLYAYFIPQVRVSFLVKDDNGEIISEKSQYFVDLQPGDKISVFPDDPFIEGKVFDHWEHETTHAVVNEDTVVTGTFNAVAVFRVIEKYRLTVNYFYNNEQSQRIDISSQVFNITKDEVAAGYTVTPPGFTIATEVTDEPTYYPKDTTITVTLDSNWQEYTDPDTGQMFMVLTLEDQYVAADDDYKVGYYLEALSGSGYELIEKVNKRGVKNTSVTPEIKEYSYADYDHRDENIILTGDPNQELKVYYSRRDFTLSYNVGGGAYIAAETVPYGTQITLPSTATRAGYTFAGWYKEAACTTSVSSPFTLKENTTLYAKWNAAQVNYQIVYMVENSNDTDYSYKGTITRQAATDSEITVTKNQADSWAPDTVDLVNYTFKDSTTETIKADGTTVITVRYSCNVYTLVSQSSGYSASVTAKYGSDITQAWTQQFNRHSGSWSYNNQNNSKFKSLTIMPSLSVRTNTSPENTIYVYHHSDNADYYQHLEYWLQNYTEGDATTTYNGKTYGRVKSIDMRYNYLSNVDDWYEITGYTKAGYTATSSATQNGTYSSFTYTWGRNFSEYYTGRIIRTYYATYTRFNFYYDAKQYTLEFYNYDGTRISTQQVTLGDDISGYLTSNVPEAPINGAEWLGWYTDQEHTSAYSGGTKMPAGLVLYGNFRFPNRTLSFDSQGGTEVTSQTKEYGFYATKPDDPTKANYTFQGWFLGSDDAASPFDWNLPITEDITVYAHWTQDTLSYTVHYYEWDSVHNQPTTTKVMPDKVVSNPEFTPGRTINEKAPTVTGFVSDKAEDTIELQFGENANVIIFYYYTIPSEITYTVKYVLKGTNIEVAQSKTVTVPGSTSVAQESAVEVDAAHLATQTSDPEILAKHYKPEQSFIEQQLAIDNNVILFEYISYTTTKITVKYLDMDGNTIADTDVNYVEKGDTFTLGNKAPDGYVYHHAYLDGTTTAPQPTYQITGNEGNLVIDIYYQKKLIIIANNKAKTYDGTALFSSFDNASDFTVTGNMRGDTLTSVAFDGSQTNAGTSATTPKNAQISKGAQAITDPEVYYSIVYVPGSLTVRPVSVFISVSADQWNTHSGSTGGPNYYTGKTFNVGFTNPNKQHFNDASGSAYVSITSSQRTLFKEKYGSAIWNALYGTNGGLISEKDAGTYTVTGAEQTAILRTVTVGGQAMMSDPNYSITLYARDSFLVIEPLPLTISTPSASKDHYDGTALTKSEGATLDHSYWTANIGGTWTAAATAAPGSVTLGTGDAITFEVTGSQTEVGSSSNTYNIVWGTAKASNYSITENLGTLTVGAAELTVTVKDIEKVYNGQKQYGRAFAEGSVTGTGQTIDTDDYNIVGLGNGDILTVTYTPAEGTNVQAADYEGSFAATYTIVNAAGIDVTGNYSSKTFTAGKLKITPATLAITVNGDSTSKVYNGNEQSYTGTVTATVTAGSGFVAQNFSYKGDYTAEGTNVGTYTVTLLEEKCSYSDFNYTVTWTIGTPVKLVITPKPVTVTAQSHAFTYTGEAQSWNQYDVSGLVGDDAISAVVTGSITFPSESPVTNELTSYTFTTGTPGNYSVTTANGQLTMTNAEVAIT